MKIYIDPKGLKLKPCLNCGIWTELAIKVCPCPNHSGEIQRGVVDGKLCIIQFSCTERRMHKGFPNTPEKPSKPRRAKRKTKVSQSRGSKTR